MIDRIVGWSDSRREGELAGFSRKRKVEEVAELKEVSDGGERTSVSEDDREKRRLLAFLKAHWETNKGLFDYWECVTSHSFAETIENIMYISFLVKENLIHIWVLIKKSN